MSFENFEHIIMSQYYQTKSSEKKRKKEKKSYGIKREQK